MWWALLAVSFTLVAASINEFWPRCTTDPGVPGLSPPETTCGNQAGLAFVLLLVAIVLGAAALRALSADRSAA
jgi:hypothetical protein